MPSRPRQKYRASGPMMAPGSGKGGCMEDRGGVSMWVEEEEGVVADVDAGIIILFDRGR